MTTLKHDHHAVITGRTMYSKNVHHLSSYDHKALKPSTNKKLGKRVRKGKLAGFPMYTLTLEERATCDRECEHWLNCYGNNMPFAHRIATDGLMDRLETELDDLDRKHPKGYLVRLHILGDFFSVHYVQFWSNQLDKRPALNIYGYTRHHPGKPIGDAIATIQGRDRFAVRFSTLPSHEYSANTEHNTRPDAIVCPVQLDKSDSCGTCTLCWTTKKPITFLDH
jgi:hypothetical protein